MDKLPDIFTARKKVNTLFGFIDVSEKSGKIVYGVDTGKTDTEGNAIYKADNEDNNMMDYIMRDPTIVNLQREIANADIKSNMKLNPGAYITAKNNDLKRIGKYIAEFFSSKYVQYLQYGYSQKEAEVRAKKDADHEEANMMAMHKSVFSKDLSQLNLDRSL